MTPTALARGLRQESADARAAFLRALSEDEVLTLEGGLLAVLLCDTSLQAREVAEQRLAARPAARRQRRPAPPAGLEEAERRRRVAAEAEDPALVAALLAYPRGRELLGAVSLDETPLDDLLLDLAGETDDPGLLQALLAMPLDVSGRAAALLARLGGRPQALREELLGCLVWAALQEAGELGAEERARARAAVARWVEGLLSAGEAGGPAFEAFLEAGGTIAHGPVSEAVPLPGPAARQALTPLARCLHLSLQPPGALLTREALEPDLTSPLAELRVAAWTRLLREGLATPEELARAAASEPAAGVATALLDALPGELAPATREPLAQLLRHRRASVRRAAAQVLARSPLVAALCAADLDPRAPTAPLALLRTLPPALRDPLLCAWLLTPRPPREAVEALALLCRPPGPAWEAWPTLLAHTDPALRAGAAAALARLPAAEGPALHAHLRPLLAADPALGLPLASRFGLPEAGPAAARALLGSGEELLCLAGAEALALAPAGDAAAWAALWEATLRRGVPGEARQRALKALLEREAPVGPEPPRLPDGAAPAWLPARSSPPGGPWSPQGALLRLVRGRDPDGLRLACQWLRARGVPPGLWAELEGRTRQLLRGVRRGPTWRLLLLVVTGLLRRLLGRRRVAPPWPARGRGGTARALGALLELQLQGGVTTLEPGELTPLLAHPLPALREPARRLYVALLGPWALPGLLAAGDQELADEALRVAHPDQVEARLRLDLRPGGPSGARELALRRAALRPSAGLAPDLAPHLAERPLPAGLLGALRALDRAPGGPAARRALLEAELARAVRAGAPEALAGAAELVQALEAWELAGALLPALERAGQAPREKIAAVLRGAAERGVRLERAALEGLLCHPQEAVRELGVGLLRRAGPEGLWATVRPLGPGRPGLGLRGAELMGRFLGACEDAWEEGMGLACEGLLGHPSGVVARRALKLLVQQGREVAATALLLRLSDPELRTPVLTALSTWSGRFLDPSRALPAELLEERRRELRALLDTLGAGPRGQAQAALAGAWEHPVPFARAAALVAVARHALEEERARVVACLGGADPVLLRAAAHAARALQPGPDLASALPPLLAAREPEVRLEARAALLLQLAAGDSTGSDAPALRSQAEPLLLDPSPEVRLGALIAACARADLLGALALEARLADPDPRVRAAALRGLARRGSGDAARLVGALRDRWPEVRQAALEAVGALQGLEAVRAEVGELLADPSPAVAEAALALLERASAPASEAAP